MSDPYPAGAIAGALGKTTPAAKQVLDYRKKFNVAAEHYAS